MLILVSHTLWNESWESVQKFCCGERDSRLSKYDLYVRPLEVLEPSDIQSADAHIVEYFHPYAQLLAASLSADMNAIIAQMEVDRFNSRSDHTFEDRAREIWRPFIRLRMSLGRCSHHLPLFNKLHGKSKKMKALLLDFNTIVGQAREFERELGVHFQMQVAIRTYEESVLSRKVGYLAFFFLSVSLTASIFGTNVDLFSHQSLRIYGLVTLGVAVLFISILYVTLNCPMAKLLYGVKQRWAWLKWVGKKVKARKQEQSADLEKGPRN